MDIEKAHAHIKDFLSRYGTNYKIYFFREECECFLNHLSEKYKNNKPLVEKIRLYNAARCIRTKDVIEFLKYYELEPEPEPEPIVNLNKRLIEAINSHFGG